ncbi:MAG: hypothetical protein LRS43_01120 [Desulfurococcales archaeon]|nr:hypothetical protein [Desulfurococcales archaeon]
MGYCDSILRWERSRLAGYLALDVAGATLGALLLAVNGFHPLLPIALLASSGATVYLALAFLKRRISALCSAVCGDCSNPLRHPGTGSYTCLAGGLVVCYSPGLERLYLYARPERARPSDIGGYPCVRFEGGEFISADGYEVYEGEATILAGDQAGHAEAGPVRVIIVDTSTREGWDAARRLLPCVGR